MLKRIRNAAIDEVFACLALIVLLCMYAYDFMVALRDWTEEQLHCCAFALFLLAAWVTDRVWKENPPSRIARFFEMTS